MLTIIISDKSSPDIPTLPTTTEITKIILSQINKYVLLRAKKVGHQTFVSFEKFNVVQGLLSFCL
jgi:hypothetical protein